MSSRPVVLALLLVGCASSPVAERPGPLVDPRATAGGVRPDRTAPPRDPAFEVRAERGAPLDTAPAVDTGLPGLPPDCAIVAPEDGAEVAAGVPIRFTAVVEDADDDVLRVLWSSDVWGPMMAGEDFQFALPAAAHEIRLEVDDAAGHRCERAILLHVR